MPKSRKRSRSKKVHEASFGDRLLANIIDLVLIIVISVISFNIFLSSNLDSANSVYSANLLETIKTYPQLNLFFLIASILLFISFLSIYYLILWVAGGGQTIGFRILKLKVIRDNKKNLNYPLAILRFATSIFSTLFLFLGFFYILFNKKCKTWHDYICQTSVIKE